MAYLDSGAMTVVRMSGVSGPGRERRALQVVDDSRNQPTQPYAAITNPTATTLLTPRTPPQVLLPETEPEGGSLRFLSLGLALGVILAFLLSGHNLVRLRTALGLAILPESALQQLQAPQPTITDINTAPRVYAASVVPMQPVQAMQTQFQPVPQTGPVLGAFPIPEVDVNHLPKHNPTTHNPAPRQASRPRSGGSKSAPAAEEAAVPFDARTIEASLKD